MANELTGMDETAGGRVAEQAARGGGSGASGGAGESGVEGRSGDAEKRKRLLEAAGVVFAEKGFGHATVRDICKRADANLASVNYYFGDKEELYGAVLREAHCKTHEGLTAALEELGGDASGEAQLKVFVSTFMEHLLGAERPAWGARLMAMEMSEPTRALDGLVEESIRPMNAWLEGVIRGLNGELSDEQVRLCTGSIFGQMLFFRQSEAVIQRLHPDIVYDARRIADIARHIWMFSLVAILSMPGEGEMAHQLVEKRGGKAAEGAGEEKSG